MRVLRSRMTTPTPTSAPVSDTRARLKARREEVERDMALIVRTPEYDQGMLTDMLRRTPPPRRAPRDGDYLHVSDLLSRCVRKKVLGMHYGTPTLSERMTISDMLTFAQGDAIHDVAKALTRDAAPAAIWGKWRCKCGNLHHNEPCTYAETDPEDICEYCGSPTNVYEEVPMRDDDLMVVGTPDLLLYLRSLDAHHISEIKSITHEQFKELVRPKPEHVLQVLFYWLLMKRKGYRVTDQVSIIYFTKTYVFKGAPYKEFLFRPEEELHRLDPYIADAYAFKAAKLDRKAKLPSRICSSGHSPEAKKCSMCKMCFSLE